MNCPFCHKPVDARNHEKGIIYHISCLLKATEKLREKQKEIQKDVRPLQQH